MRARSLFPLLAAFLTAGCTDRNTSPLTGPEAPMFAMGSCELGLSDQDARDAINDLIAEVNALEASGDLTSGQANALRTHLENALRQIDAGQYCAALAQLRAFREQVGNFVNDGVLTPEQSQALTGSATLVIDGLPNRVTVDPPSAAEGTYQATGAAFGPEPTTTGTAGALVVVNDGSGSPTLGCGALVGFTAGAIALIDRGTCTFVQKVKNAQDAGAVAVIIMNNVAGWVTLGGADPTSTIPAVSISQADGATIRSALPATGKVSKAP